MICEGPLVIKAMSHITQLEEKVESSKDLEKQLSAKFYEMEKQWNAVSTVLPSLITIISVTI